MIDFIIYNDDGDILRTGRAKTLDGQARQGENIIEGVADDVKHKVVNGEIVERELCQTYAMARVREKRNSMLVATDWTQIPDVPLTDSQKEQYKKYRKALRDLPSKYDTINSIDEVIYPRLEDFNEE